MKMVRHILLWKFSRQVIEEGRQQEALALMSASVSNMVGKIPGLIRAEIGGNLTGNACDFVFYAELEDMDALAAYQVHPLHVAHKERSAPLVEAPPVVADYICGE